ncbi:flavodoxin [Salipiger pacificus]|nr:flavodoxin [Alloyangia pacifica]
MTDRTDLNRRLALAGLILPVLGAGFLPAQARAATPPSSTLVAYLTRSGNTRVVAETLARRQGADLFEIRTATPYPEDYDAHVELARQQRDAGIAPPLASTVPGFESYQEICLCFPIWGEAMPAPLRSFLKAHDVGTRRVLPFITHGGYGRGSSLETLAELAPQARIAPAFEQTCDAERDTIDLLADWFARTPG